MPDETMKCPACGGELLWCNEGYDHPCIGDCSLNDTWLTSEGWAEIERLRNTLPDGTELEPGSYLVQRYNNDGRVDTCLMDGRFGKRHFTIPAPTAPEPPVDEATLDIIRAAYPSIHGIEWMDGEWFAVQYKNGGKSDKRYDMWRIDPALLPPWEGEGEPPVIPLREDTQCHESQ